VAAAKLRAHVVIVMEALSATPVVAVVWLADAADAAPLSNTKTESFMKTKW
jgi:hypothetical protein